MGLHGLEAFERGAGRGGTIAVGGVESDVGRGDFGDAPDVGVEVVEESGGGGQGGCHVLFILFCVLGLLETAGCVCGEFSIYVGQGRKG